MRVLLVLAAPRARAAPVGGAARRAELFVNALDTRPGATAETDVELSLPGGAASVALYVPPGYALDLGRRPGSAIGSVTVTTSVRLTADLFVVGSAAWRAGGLTLAVDRDALAFSPPAGTSDVELDLRGVLVNPSAPSVLTWRAVVTPAKGAPFELRSIVAVPQVLTLKYAASTLRGRLLFAGTPRPGVNVHLDIAAGDELSDRRELGVARTGADGRFVYRLAQPPPARQLLVVAYVNFYDGPCSGLPLVPGGCERQSIAPPPAQVVAVSGRAG